MENELKEKALEYLTDHINDWAYYGLDCFFTGKSKLSAENLSCLRKFKFKVVLDD